uniref:BAG domain-containing protein n=1 Tax=Panagrellus redivivus TaxID=6233 RepID=A0A7E4ZS67_PANRE
MVAAQPNATPCIRPCVQLMQKLELDQEKMDDVSNKLRSKLIASLLENDILTAENYTEDVDDDTSSKKEDDLLERANQQIKNLIQQLLDKDAEITNLKAQLSSNGFLPATAAPNVRRPT